MGVRYVTSEAMTQPEVMLDLVDAVLHLDRVSGYWVERLDDVLLLGGSVWQVSQDRSQLVRRVDPAATTAFADASSPRDAASAELQAAWGAAYGRNPDASDAWDHAIKAAETLLIPIVTPAKAKATLGDVVGSLSSQGHLWELELAGQDGSGGVAPLVSILRVIWPNPDRHGNSGTRQPSLLEAQAVVHLAITIVQWARADVLKKRPKNAKASTV
jgi:hypothetical protein